jgi:hypothetical protein
VRPRLLLVPGISRHEWPTLPLLEQWADVAVVEGPWVEDGSAARRAVEELEAHGWSRAVVVCDEWAIWKVVEIAELRPHVFQAFAHGHACTRLARRGGRPTMNPPVVETYTQLLHTDFRTWSRALTQTTRGDYDETQVERFLAGTKHEDVITMFDRIADRDGESFADTIHALGVPLLLAHHTECLLWTEEGFREAVAEFPGATTVSVKTKPSASPEFADALRDFCLSLPDSD